MDIGKSFTFMFDDEKWVEKLVIGALLALASIIPLVNLFTGLVLIGYTLRLIKNVAEGNETPLPAWDDWGGDWVKGLMAALAWGIYSIPIWLASGAGALFEALAQSSDAAGVCSVAVGCLSVLWGLAMGVVLPAGVINYAVSGEFSSFFRFGDMFRLIGDNLGNYVVAILLGFVASIVASFGVILCGIGIFFTCFWGTLVSAHLLGQVKAGAAGPKLAVVASAPVAATYGELNEIDLGQDTEIPGKED
jgi:hypothetical protein